MAICVQLSGRTLTAVGDYTADCAGYALMTAQEYASTPTLAALFAMPDPETIQTAFMAGLSLPLILWLTAWGFGVVVGYINSRAEPLTIEE
ncbi:hypothetical protein [Stutzerimonas balearica]|uniref:hypothetical protein n=1 Tax=Stutzerimonas balearica TaxID=74829 RepID=UPI0022B05C1C|nr:hypothetical protein [Stutzerimonas balearica]MCZ4130387.1 hypothetical protein [Stutzerimonas balearica]MCZ4130396.1 hypothetical protein [Stutzerimonas balearica]